MPTWEQINCQIESANQGYGKCATDFEALTYMLAIPKGRVFTQAELADWQTTLMTLTTADNPADRGYLLGPFPNFEQQNTTPGTQTATNGLVRTVANGFFAWTVQQWSGGFCGYRNLLKMHLKQDKYDFLLVHGSKIIGGVLAKDATGADGMRGVQMTQVFTPNWTQSNGGNAGTLYSLEFKVGDSEQMRSLYTFLPFDFDIETVARRIIDVELSGAAVSGSPTGDYDILAVASCGGDNLSVDYATELADDSLWIARNALTKAIIPTTSVTLQASGKFRVLLDTTSANYPTAGQKIIISLAPISALDAAGIIGYESNSVTLIVA